MKRIILILLMVLPLLLGQAVIRQNPVSVAWDAVAPMGDDTIGYEVFIAPVGDYLSAQSVAVTSSLEMEVTIPDEGNWVVGVRTIRTILSDGEVLYSEINWSDTDGLATPNPFIVRYHVVPAAPFNFRVQ